MEGEAACIRRLDRQCRPAQVSTRLRKPDCLSYGYFFWPGRHGTYRAEGKEGQFIIVLPGQDAVIAVNSDEPKLYPILDTVWNEILPVTVTV